MDSSAVDMFMMLTGASLDVALRCLEITSGNIELATEMYFEDPQTFGEATNQQSSDMSWDNRQYKSSESPPYIPPEDDENVRAPIPQRKEVLMAPDPMDHLRPLIANPYQMRQQLNQSIPSPFYPNSDAIDPFGDFATESELNERAKSSRLEQLFQPPTKIMFKGTLEEAKHHAQEKKQWVMVNIKMFGEFSCEVQNRDLWSDKDVQDFVRANFIFLQLSNTSSEGETFLRRYPTDSFPYIAILDPRTGERVKLYSYHLSPSEFLGEVTEWLSEHSLEDFDLKMSSFGDQPRKTTPNRSGELIGLSEEEQIEAAIAMSLAENEKPLPHKAPYNAERQNSFSQTNSSFNGPLSSQNNLSAFSLDRSFSNFGSTSTSSPAPLQIPSPVQTPPPSTSAIIPNLRPEIPANAPNATKIQIRLLDNSKPVFRFLKTDKVRTVYEHVKASVPSLKDINFELMMHTKKMSEQLDLTIEEADMANASLTVSLP